MFQCVHDFFCVYVCSCGMVFIDFFRLSVCIQHLATPSNNAVVQSSNIATHGELHNIQLDVVLAREVSSDLAGQTKTM